MSHVSPLHYGVMAKSIRLIGSTVSGLPDGEWPVVWTEPMGFGLPSDLSTTLFIPQKPGSHPDSWTRFFFLITHRQCSADNSTLQCLKKYSVFGVLL